MSSLATQKDVLEISDDDEEENDSGNAPTTSNGTSQGPSINVDEEIALTLDSGHAEPDFEADYGLLAPEQTIVFRAYSDDSDDKVLEEISPRFIVMYEPNPEFIRRIEVCSATSTR